MDKDYCYLKMSAGDIERRNCRSRLRSGWDDVENGQVITSDVLLMDLISTKILSKISFVVFSSHQR